MKKLSKLDKNKVVHVLKLAQAAKEAGIKVEFMTSVVRPSIHLNKN